MSATEELLKTCAAWSQGRQPLKRPRLPSIGIPPWAGGESHQAVPPGVVGADHPAIGTAPPSNVAPADATVIPSARKEDRLRHWNINELLRHTRLAEHGAQRSPVLLSKLGHFDHLLDVSTHEDFHQLFHLRHRSIENWHPTHGVDELVPAGVVWSHRRQAPRQRPRQSTGCLLAGVLPELGRVPPPRPWPSSGAVRGGAETWPRPHRSTVARVATTSAVVAACAAGTLEGCPARCPS